MWARHSPFEWSALPPSHPEELSSSDFSAWWESWGFPCLRDLLYSGASLPRSNHPCVDASDNRASCSHCPPLPLARRSRFAAQTAPPLHHQQGHQGQLLHTPRALLCPAHASPPCVAKDRGMLVAECECGWHGGHHHHRLRGKGIFSKDAADYSSKKIFSYTEEPQYQAFSEHRWRVAPTFSLESF